MARRIIVPKLYTCICVFLCGCIVVYLHQDSTIQMFVPPGDSSSRYVFAQPERIVPASNDPDGPSDVLISSYMRSGSTFIGELLGLRNDSFYFYEPFWRIHNFHYYKDEHRTCAYKNTGCVNVTEVNSRNIFRRAWWRIWNGEYVPLQTAQAFLLSIYNCSFYQYPQFFQEDIHALGRLAGPKWSKYRSCRENKGSTTECLQSEATLCRSSKHRVTKLIRMSPATMRPLLQIHPRLKIVHLFRDPRGVINSHINTEFYGTDTSNKHDFKEDVTSLCKRLFDDIISLKTLMKEFPGRVTVIQYEDFSNSASAIPKVNYLYKFFNMNLSVKYKDFVKSVIKPAEETNNQSLAGNHPFTFRKRLDFSLVRIIDAYCDRVYTELGYVRFYSERDFRNVSKSSFLDPLPYTIPAIH